VEEDRIPDVEGSQRLIERRGGVYLGGRIRVWRPKFAIERRTAASSKGRFSRGRRKKSFIDDRTRGEK